MNRLFLAALALCLVCCNRQTDCPPFPDVCRNWLPYHEGDEATFGAGSARQTFTFNDVFATQQYTIGTTEACNCEASAHANSAIDSVANLQLLCSAVKERIRYKFVFEFQHYGKMSSYYVPVAIDRFIFSIRNNGDFEGATIRNNVTIGSQRLDSVLVIENDTVALNKADIYRIYLVHGKGVVRYDRRSGNNYTLTGL